MVKLFVNTKSSVNLNTYKRSRSRTQTSQIYFTVFEDTFCCAGSRSYFRQFRRVDIVHLAALEQARRNVRDARQKEQTGKAAGREGLQVPLCAFPSRSGPLRCLLVESCLLLCRMKGDYKVNSVLYWDDVGWSSRQAEGIR